MSEREGGEVRPKRPTVGKEKLGITFSGTNHGRDSEPKIVLPQTQQSASQAVVSHFAVCWAAQLCAKLGVAGLVSNSVKRVGTEEPYEGNLHVRVCGEGAG